jgi:dihydroxy-acid dehydratase
VLHVSPEAADPASALGVVGDGDVVEFDVEKRVLCMHVADDEIRRRLEERQRAFERAGGSGSNVDGGAGLPPWEARKGLRGYRGLYMREVVQADFGADFGFLTAAGPLGRS